MSFRILNLSTNLSTELNRPMPLNPYDLTSLKTTLFSTKQGKDGKLSANDLKTLKADLENRMNNRATTEKLSNEQLKAAVLIVTSLQEKFSTITSLTGKTVIDKSSLDWLAKLGGNASELIPDDIAQLLTMVPAQSNEPPETSVDPVIAQLEADISYNEQQMLVRMQNGLLTEEQSDFYTAQLTSLRNQLNQLIGK